MRKIYLDVLRIISCMAVVMFHIAGLWIQKNPITSSSYIFAQSIILLSSFMVPMFVMISGVVFLDLNREISFRHIGKKIIGLLKLYFVWSLVYYIFLGAKSQSITEFVHQIVGGHYHLWYIPMCIGLYSVVPLLRSMFAQRENVIYFVVMSFILNFICLVLYQTGWVPDLYTVIGKLQLNMFTGWIFYFVWGYSLSLLKVDKKIRILIYVLTGITVIAVLINVVYTALKGQNAVYVYNDFSLNRGLYVTAIFLIFKENEQHFRNWINKSRKSYVGILQLSQLTLGVYLVHALVIEKRAVLHIALDECNPIWAILCMTMAVCVISFLTVYILNKIPVVRKVFLA